MFLTNKLIKINASNILYNTLYNTFFAIGQDLLKIIIFSWISLLI